MLLLYVIRKDYVFNYPQRDLFQIQHDQKDSKWAAIKIKVYWRLSCIFNSQHAKKAEPLLTLPSNLIRFIYLLNLRLAPTSPTRPEPKSHAAAGTGTAETFPVRMAMAL